MSGQRSGISAFDPSSGMVKTGTIVGYDLVTNKVQVQLNESPAMKGTPLAITVPAYFTHAESGGLFMGSLPVNGTTVTLAQSTGGQY